MKMKNLAYWENKADEKGMKSQNFDVFQLKAWGHIIVSARGNWGGRLLRENFRSIGAEMPCVLGFKLNEILY